MNAEFLGLTSKNTFIENPLFGTIFSETMMDRQTDRIKFANIRILQFVVRR